MPRPAATFAAQPYMRPDAGLRPGRKPEPRGRMSYMSGTRLACLALTLVATSAAAGDGGLRAAVYPRTILAGGTVRLTCSVPHDPDHRWLEMGIEGLRTSGGDLEGERAAVTHVMLIERVPCGTEEAFCRVDGAVHQPERALALFLVGGCGDQDSPFTR